MDEIKPYDPSLRERMAGGLQQGMEALGMSRYPARQAAQTIVGGQSSRLPLNLGLMDVASAVNMPAALATSPVYADEGIRSIQQATQDASRGDYAGAATEGLFGVLNTLPMVSGVTRIVRKFGAPLKPIAVPDTPALSEDLPRRQVRRPDGLSEPEVEQAREQSRDRLRRLLEPNYQRGGAVKETVKGAFRQVVDLLSPAEREANKAKFLEESKVQERLYHATPRDFSEFMPGGENPAVSGPAIWMSPSATNQPAAHNIRTIPGKPGHVYRDPNMYTPGTNVMPLYSSIKNPLVATESTWKQDFKPFGGGSPWTMTVEEVQRMKDAGHDGILYYNKNGALEEVIAFEPQQVKSAIGNRGTYDPAERDITKARGGLAAVTRRK